MPLQLCHLADIEPHQNHIKATGFHPANIFAMLCLSWPAGWRKASLMTITTDKDDKTLSGFGCTGHGIGINQC